MRLQSPRDEYCKELTEVGGLQISRGARDREEGAKVSKPEACSLRSYTRAGFRESFRR